MPRPAAKPWHYGAYGAAVLIVALGGWRIYQPDTAAGHGAAAVSAAPETELRALSALHLERARVEALAHELAMARRDLEAHAITVAEKAALEQRVADLHESLRRAEALSNVLDTLLSAERQHSIALAERAATLAEASPLPPQSEATANENSMPVESESLPPAPVSSALAPPAGDSFATAAVPSGPAEVTPETGPVEPAMERVDGEPAVEAPPVPPPSVHASPRAIERLMERARLLLSQGEIGGARIVLEQAAALGNRPALLTLGETYDPAVLAEWGTIGTQGDIERARAFYARALAAGATEAEARLIMLP